jgi:membrane dipeptidase
MPAVSNPPIFDGHNDVLLSLYSPERGEGRSFFERGMKGHLDLPRALEGGFAGGFFAVFVPRDPDEPALEGPRRIELENGGYEVRMDSPLKLDYAQRVTLAVIGRLYRLERESAGQVRIVRDSAELARCLADGTLAAVLHFEGAEAIDPALDALYVYHAAGLRSLGLVWSRANAFACGVPFKFPHSPDTGPGLTEAGERLVRACNELGIMVDLSHLNEAGFWDVARISQAPLVATHSCAHTISPGTRNLTDKQLDAIGGSGGVVGVNFGVGFARADGRNDAETPLALYARHARYIADRIGVEHVALGSDFDGATIASALVDAAGLPRLLDALREAGFDEPALAQVAHENWQRVLRATWTS